MKKKTAAELMLEHKNKVNAALVQTKPKARKKEILKEENMSLGAIVGFILGGFLGGAVGAALAAKYDRYVDEWSMAHADLAPNDGEIGVTFFPGTKNTGKIFSEVKIQQHNERGFSIVDFLDEDAFIDNAARIGPNLAIKGKWDMLHHGIRVRTGFIVPVSENAKKECQERVNQCAKYVWDRVNEDLRSAGKAVGQGIRNIGKRFSKPKTTVAPESVVATESWGGKLGWGGAIAGGAVGFLGGGPIGSIFGMVIGAITGLVQGGIEDSEDNHEAKEMFMKRDVEPFIQKINAAIERNGLKGNWTSEQYPELDDPTRYRLSFNEGSGAHIRLDIKIKERWDDEEPFYVSWRRNAEGKRVTLGSYVRYELTYSYTDSNGEYQYDDFNTSDTVTAADFIVRFMDIFGAQLKKKIAPLPGMKESKKLKEKDLFKRKDKDYNREFRQVVQGVINDFKGMSVKVELEEPGVASILKLMFKGEELATAKMNINGDKITLDCEAPGFFNKITGKKSDWIVPKDSISTFDKLKGKEDGKSLVQKYRYHLKQKLETVYKDGGNKKAKKKEEPAAEEPASEKSDVKENRVKWLNRQLRQVESKKKIFEDEYGYDFSRPKLYPLERLMEPSGKWRSKLQELQWKMSDLAKDKTVDHLILYAEKNRNLGFGNIGLQLSSNNDRDHFEFEGTDGYSIKFKGHIGPLNSIWLDVDNGKDTSELPKGYNWLARPSVVRITPDVLTVWNPAGDSIIQETVSSATKLISILENIADTALRTEKVDPEHPPFLKPRSF